MRKRKNVLRSFYSRIPRAFGVGAALMFTFWATNDFKLDNLWVAPVILIALAVLSLPAILVQVFDLRVKHTKPVFVEPGPIKIALVLMLWAAIAFILTLVIAETLDIPERYIGWELLVWAIVTLGVPINGYMVYIHTRYKRVVEYGTAEWKRLHKERPRKTWLPR